MMLLPKPSYDSLALAVMGLVEVLMAFALAGVRARLQEPSLARAATVSLSEPTPYQGAPTEG